MVARRKWEERNDRNENWVRNDKALQLLRQGADRILERNMAILSDDTFTILSCDICGNIMFYCTNSIKSGHRDIHTT